MSTTVTKKTYNGKKNYYGKYYTYKKIRNLMNTYFRAKLTISVNTIVQPIPDVQDQWRYQIHHNNQNLNGVSLANLVTGCPRWGAYRLLFGYYKCRGVVIEVVPGNPTIPLLVNEGNILQPFQGSIALALTSSQDEQSFAQIQEANMKVVFSRTETVRKYFAFFIKDFTQSPNANNILPMGVPYNVFINQSSVMNNVRGQHFQINFTFYITFRQSLA